MRDLQMVVTVSSGSGGDRVCVRVGDKASRMDLITAYLSFAQWGEIVAGRRHIDIAGEVETRPAALAKREYCTVLADVSLGHENAYLIGVADAAARAKGEGWRGNWRELDNSHNGPRNARKFVLTRWVNDLGEPVAHPHYPETRPLPAERGG